MQTHTYECSYPCSSSEKAFAQSSQISKHMNTNFSAKETKPPSSDYSNIYGLHDSHEPYIVHIKTEEQHENGRR